MSLRPADLLLVERLKTGFTTLGEPTGWITFHERALERLLEAARAEGRAEPLGLDSTDERFVRAYDAGHKTAKKLADAAHDFSVEYSTMAVVQDALRAFNSSPKQVSK